MMNYPLPLHPYALEDLSLEELAARLERDLQRPILPNLKSCAATPRNG